MAESKTHSAKNVAAAYLMENSLQELEVLKEIRQATDKHVPRWSLMLTDAVQVQFMRIVLKSINVKKFIEVGVFTGYNLASVASVVPDGGVVVGCDVSEEFTNIGKEAWTKAGLQDKINIQIRPAVETLDALIKNGESGTFDGAYIDADKTGYDAYYEKCLTLLRPNGFIFLDNMFQFGNVFCEESKQHADSKHIRALTKKIQKDARVDSALLSIGDGLLMCRKI